MFDVFTEQIEVLIKDGIANLYWYKGDLQKAWLRAGVSAVVTQVHLPREGRRRQFAFEAKANGPPL